MSLNRHYSNVIEHWKNIDESDKQHQAVKDIDNLAKYILKNLDFIVSTIESKIFNSEPVKTFIELPLIQEYISNNVKFFAIDYGDRNFYITDSNRTKVFRVDFNKNFGDIIESNFCEKGLSINFYYSPYFNLYFNSLNSYDYSELINNSNHIAQSKYGSFEKIFHFTNFNFNKFNQLESFVKNLNIESIFHVKNQKYQYSFAFKNKENIEYDNFELFGDFLIKHNIINNNEDFLLLSNKIDIFDLKLKSVLNDISYDYLSFIKGLKIDIINIKFKEFCFFIFIDRFKENFDLIMDCQIYGIRKTLSPELPLYALDINEIYSIEGSGFTFRDFIENKDDFYENIQLIEY